MMGYVSVKEQKELTAQIHSITFSKKQAGSYGINICTLKRVFTETFF
ncbi:hypothetical protein SAMD00020551_4216 [Mesobacillus selenatarsenatis SF-1]|uniref:Uncharacterized protein n=1 Tax=Mesobacillus selenatarsenatis (strain DSM 18680 / JCM 14380 / FERM P-15431 / SF-1) TaxID=1321606 RepID=A0A0A8X9U8_MESS1|nr:hypothetical protein SAMD00020551_4216 [Mesobacillus selenatarsenatis SF-1]